MEKYTTSEIIPELSSLISSKKIEILNKEDMLDIINHFLEKHNKPVEREITKNRTILCN
jgi:hypothetical protein